jgi:hypothetical protein
VEEKNLTGVIYERLRGVYGDACMGAGSVRRWVKYYKNGNTDIADQPLCGQQRTAATESNRQEVDELIRQDGRVTVRETAGQIAVEVLGYRKFCSRWIPRFITDTKGHKTVRNIHSTVRIWIPETNICS